MPDSPPPSAPGVQLSGVQSTPPSNGAGSNTAHKIHPTQDAYKPYLAVDITPSPAIPFDQFLSHIFSPQQTQNYRDLDKIKAKIKKDRKFKALLASYADTKVKGEVDRYEPFNSLVNRIISLLGPSSQLPIVICRNDPTKIMGSDGFRKPDCVIVHQRSRKQSGTNADDPSARGPPKHKERFHWHEILAFVEFKLVKNVARPEETVPEPQKPKQPTRPPKSAQEKSKSGPSKSGPSKIGPSKSGSTRLLRSDTKAAAASSSSNNPGLLSTSSNHISHLAPSPHISENGKSASSSKRSGEDSETHSNKRHKGEAEHPERSGLLPPKNDLIQCASYALEMLSKGGLFTHALGALVTDGVLELLYYDRSLAIRSKPVNFITDPSSLIDFVYCMHHASMKQWGRLDMIKMPEDFSPTLSKEVLRSATLTLTLLNGTLILKLQDIVFTQHALIGRGTCVVDAEILQGPEEWRSEPIVVKFSFTPGTRISEGQMLRDIVMRAEDSNDTWVLDHLPCLLHHEAFAPDETDKTSIQYRLKKYLASENIEYEERTLQVLVMKKLYPISDKDTDETLIPLIKDIFKCYKWLYETAKIMHRDISENNLMYRKKAGGAICGVLSDYDLSLMLARQDLGPSSKQRTGTRPFMARDLLEPTPIQHLYRHDLESLFYVTVVLMFRFHGKILKEEDRFKNFPELVDWFALAPAQLLDKKIAFFSKELLEAPSAFKVLEVLVVKMQIMFANGYQARLNHKRALFLSNEKLPAFDESTLDGHVNFDEFQKILYSV